MLAVHERAILDTYRVTLSGPLNVGQAGGLVQCFRDLSARGITRLVIDLEGVPFLDSRGLGALIAGYKLFGSDGRNFRLVGLGIQPRLVLELTGYDQVFGI